MKVLHILADGPTELSSKVMDIEKKGNEVKVIDLSKKGASYEAIVDDIFSYDRVISW